MTTIAQALAYAAGRFQNHDQPRLDAEVLLAHVLNRPRSYLHAWPEATLTSGEESRFLELVERRSQGQPVAYLTGHREFWSLDLEVTPDTLIPRPETELLVEQTLVRIPDGKPVHVADLGTGSGAVALALACERPRWCVLASDRSAAGLAVAAGNARRLGLHNVYFIRGSWCDFFADHTLDAIVSNPPYVAERDDHLTQGDVRFEPPGALAAGEEGLDDLVRLVETAPRTLKAGGWLLLEHAPEQTRKLHKLLKYNGFIDIYCGRDLAGLERISCARMPK